MRIGISAHILGNGLRGHLGRTATLHLHMILAYADIFDRITADARNKRTLSEV